MRVQPAGLSLRPGSPLAPTRPAYSRSPRAGATWLTNSCRLPQCRVPRHSRPTPSVVRWYDLTGIERQPCAGPRCELPLAERLPLGAAPAAVLLPLPLGSTVLLLLSHVSDW
eukprot:scaffold6392_cov55-Phaeocystis_antarctica.AAC.2